MNADNIAVTQQEEEEFSAMSKVEPKEGEWWLCDMKKDGRQALYLGANGWIFSESSDDIIDNASPISRLYTQEEYDNKPVNPVDDLERDGESDLIRAQREIAAILGKYKVALIARSVKGKHDNNKHMQFPVIGFQDYNHCSEYETERSHITGYELYSIIADQLKEDKEAREQAEMIDDACELLFGDSAEQCRDDVRSTVESMIVAGYRK